MWLFTKFGFYSIQKRPQDRHLTIRARIAADLDALRKNYLPELGENKFYEGTDYPVRAFVMPEFLGRALVQIMLDIDYSNFKMAVGQEQGHRRSSIYHRVWSNLLALEHMGQEKPGLYDDLQITFIERPDPADVLGDDVPVAVPDWVEE